MGLLWCNVVATGPNLERSAVFLTLGWACGDGDHSLLEMVMILMIA